MVIKLINQIRYCTVSVITLIFIGVLGLAVYNNQHKSIKFVFMPHVSTSMYSGITQVLNAVASDSAQAMYDGLKLTYSSIARVLVHDMQRPIKQRVVTIEQEKPYCVINGMFIITEQGHQASFEAYPLGVSEHVRHVQSDVTTQKDLYDVYVFMSRLPACMLENYTIIWHNAMQVELRHMVHPYTVIASGETIFSASLLKALHALINHEEMCREGINKKAAQLNMDVRYKNSIILVRQKGGKLL